MEASSRRHSVVFCDRRSAAYQLRTRFSILSGSFCRRSVPLLQQNMDGKSIFHHPFDSLSGRHLLVSGMAGDIYRHSSRRMDVAVSLRFYYRDRASCSSLRLQHIMRLDKGAKIQKQVQSVIGYRFDNQTSKTHPDRDAFFCSVLRPQPETKRGSEQRNLFLS